jgi:thioredoxin 1
MQSVTSNKEYKDLKSTKQLVVVQFSAEWCGPCKAVKPQIQKLAEKYKELTFLYVDVDNEQLANCSDGRDVRGVPTFKFFKEGELLESFSGANAAKVEETIKKYK